MSDRYILDNRKAVKCDDLMVWAKWFESGDVRRVASTVIGTVRISTVFLSLDHAFGGGEPMLFETMVFGGPLDESQERCSTWEQAEALHLTWVEMVEAAGTAESAEAAGKQPEALASDEQKGGA